MEESIKELEERGLATLTKIEEYIDILKNEFNEEVYNKCTEEMNNYLTINDKLYLLTTRTRYIPFYKLCDELENVAKK